MEQMRPLPIGRDYERFRSWGRMKNLQGDGRSSSKRGIQDRK
jgi:hypothetical protein